MLTTTCGERNIVFKSEINFLNKGENEMNHEQARNFIMQALFIISSVKKDYDLTTLDECFDRNVSKDFDLIIKKLDDMQYELYTEI